MTLCARTCTAVLALATAAVALPAAAEEIKFMADLSAEVQVPPVDSEGTGMADITVDTEAMTVAWSLAYHGLTGMPVAAHFHGPAMPDETAPPVIDLTTDMDEGTASAAATATVTTTEGTETATASDTDIAEEVSVAVDILGGSAEITEEQLAQLQDGMWYINIHTEQYPDGEIRGQVVEGEADMSAAEGNTSGNVTEVATSGEASEGAVAGELVADIGAGEDLYQEVCRACHGPRAQGMASFPKLAGHEAAYLADRLHQYKAGEKVGPNSALMYPIAGDLSEEDIANVTAYIASAFE